MLRRVASVPSNSPAHTPVIIGVGQILQRIDDPFDAHDATSLMADAARAAAADCMAQQDVLRTADVLAVVRTLSWRYGDAARLVCDALGIAPRRVVTPMGGNSPQSLVNAASKRIANGELTCAILVGGETWRSRMRARKLGVELDWPKVDDALVESEPPETWGHELHMSSPEESAIGLTMPVQVYPMFETAIRAARRVDTATHLRDVGAMWARFSEVASRNPFAWSQRSLTADEVVTPNDRNRMVGYPYTKSMNSNNDVDMSACIIVCSAEHAQRLGVPRDKWVFPLSGSDCHEHAFISDRATFAKTPAVELGGRAALRGANLEIDDVAHLDLYSCFPSAVQLGATSLGLDPYTETRPLTQTGGLSFSGGPWNNYVMHSIATMVETLRQDPGSNGIVWANGGFVTKHAFGLYSTTPPAERFVHDEPQEAIDALPRAGWASAEDAAADGKTTIEAFTVMHGRDATPESAWVAIRLSDGRRTFCTSTKPDVMNHLLDGEHVGERATVTPAADFVPAA